MVGVLLIAACGGGGDDGGVAAEDTPVAETAAGETSGPPDTGAAAAPVTEPAPVELLAPISSFPIDDVDLAASIAMAPDGAAVAVGFHEATDQPTFLRVYDAMTGDILADIDADVRSLGRIGWTTDGRLIAADSIDEVWRTWDPATLAEAPPTAYTFDCGFGQFDPVTGFHFSFDDDDNLCRADPATGSVERTAAGLIVDPERQFWLRPERGEVVVQHYPGDLLSLLTIDVSSLEQLRANDVENGTFVDAVGATTWFDDLDSAVLEPGGIPAPDTADIPDVSPFGAYFYVANGPADVVFYDATTGSSAGSISAGGLGMQWSGWSADDDRLARLSVDGQIEVYDLP